MRITAELPPSPREHTDVEPKLKPDPYADGDRTYDSEPEPIGDNRADQNCNGDPMTLHVDSSVGLTNTS